MENHQWNSQLLIFPAFFKKHHRLSSHAQVFNPILQPFSNPWPEISRMGPGSPVWTIDPWEKWMNHVDFYKRHDHERMSTKMGVEAWKKIGDGLAGWWPVVVELAHVLCFSWDLWLPPEKDPFVFGDANVIQKPKSLVLVKLIDHK